MTAKLRIYLGCAPGVGKTYAMLNEGWRRVQRGTDTVIGYVETHGRPNTAAQLHDLELIPRRQMEYRGQTFEEMDLDAILARRPTVVLVDELAHTNVPGSRHTKRWQDVNELLDAGIEVITTVNVQHLESLNDVVNRITGIPQRETIPDRVARAADEIELVDMSPEALRRRMAHGNIYASDKVDAAMGNYFRIGNLTALRELALLWLADKVEDGLQAYREAHGIAEGWETKERVVVALTGSPKGDQLIRRGARMAARARAELVGVHIRSDDGLTQPDVTATLAAHRALIAELGGRLEEITGGDPAQALVEFARSQNATQLIMGATQRSRRSEIVHGSIVNRVIRASREIDVHVISTTETPVDRQRTSVLPDLALRGRLAPLARRRLILGWFLAVTAVPGLALVLIPVRNTVQVTGALPLLLLATVAVAAVGGLLPGLLGALVAFGFADWYFIAPLHSFTIGRAGDTVALVAFLVAATVVSLMADQVVRRRLEAARARSEAEQLARLAGGALLTSPSALGDLLNELRSTFALDSAAILSPTSRTEGARTNQAWTVQASAGAPPPASPDEAPFALELADGAVFVMSATHLDASDRNLLGAFVAQLRIAQHQTQLQDQADKAKQLSEADDLRNALLAAVSHDLRTPLASIKASADSLLSLDVQWSAQDVKWFCQTISTETTRLNTLIANLLDMSRLRAGIVHLAVQPVDLDEVVHAALASLGSTTSAVSVEVPELLPPVAADPALLERAVANLADNALKFSPPDLPVHIQADLCGERVDLRVVDQGPGIPPRRRASVLEPGQDRGDDETRGQPDGMGLGLAVVKGFVEAMNGELTLDDTPGGGLTATISLNPFIAGRPSESRQLSPQEHDFVAE